MRTTAIFDEAFSARLGWLVLNISKVSETEISHSSPQIKYLSFLKKGGHLAALNYVPDEQPNRLPGDSGSFYFSLDRGQIKFGVEFKRAWLSMSDALQLTDDEFFDSIDNFILHELFHVGQNLTTARHSDISDAAAILRVVDYHADANAVISAMILNAETTPIEPQYWKTLYPRIVKAVLRQMFVFDFAADLKRISVPRFMRIFTWHYQFHRVRAFRGADPFNKYHLSVEPAFSFRNFDAAHRVGDIPMTWPTEEPSDFAKDKPHVWMAVPNDFGIPMIHRFLSTKRANYAALFEGVFECNTDKSEHFLDEMFNAIPDLIGRAESDTDAKARRGQIVRDLAQELGRESWICDLRDEGHEILSAIPALNALLDDTTFQEFLTRSRLYESSWNKSNIDGNREAFERLVMQLRRKYREKFELRWANYPPR
jgi:hypothetical protein